MTLIVARMFGPRIITMSDTMISDKRARAPNIIPGRLKSIVLNDWLTVSYSGLAIQGLDAIRALAKNPGLSTDSAISTLAETSTQFQGEVDFIICSHEHPAAPRLIKIASGTAFEGAAGYWIGSGPAAAGLARFPTNATRCENLPDYLTQDELDFTNRFRTYMSESDDSSIGGAVINSLASDIGHCYQDHAAVHHWGTITIPNDDDPAERAALHKTGIVSHEYHAYSAVDRGIAIVGLYLGQPAVGYIYDPLAYDEALLLRVETQAEFREALTRYEQRRKSGWQPVGNRSLM